MNTLTESEIFELEVEVAEQMNELYAKANELVRNALRDHMQDFRAFARWPRRLIPIISYRKFGRAETGRFYGKIYWRTLDGLYVLIDARLELEPVTLFVGKGVYLHADSRKVDSLIRPTLRQLNVLTKN